MAKILITEHDLTYLREHYPLLKYDKSKNTISGVLAFDLVYNKIRIRDKFNIEINLESPKGSVLPIVKEVLNRIVKISERKKIALGDLHLNNTQGELCLIIPPKEKERYPKGFDLKEFLRHLEEHLYWVSYYERYEKEPWKGQAHGIQGYIELYDENHSYRADVKKMVEEDVGKKLSRPEFRRLIKTKRKNK